MSAAATTNELCSCTGHYSHCQNEEKIIWSKTKQQRAEMRCVSLVVAAIQSAELCSLWSHLFEGLDWRALSPLLTGSHTAGSRVIDKLFWGRAAPFFFFLQIKLMFFLCSGCAVLLGGSEMWGNGTGWAPGAQPSRRCHTWNSRGQYVAKKDEQFQTKPFSWWFMASFMRHVFQGCSRECKEWSTTWLTPISRRWNTT